MVSFEWIVAWINTNSQRNRNLGTCAEIIKNKNYIMKKQPFLNGNSYAIKRYLKETVQSELARNLEF